MGAMHGYGLAKRIEQIGEEALRVNQGTIYLCLVRLVNKRWISASWGTSKTIEERSIIPLRRPAANS